MSGIVAGGALLLLLIGTPVAAEEFSVVVMRGSTIVRVTGSEGGEMREETLREDPTPELPASETEAPARVASDDSPPTVRVVVDEAETTSSAGYVVVKPRARHLLRRARVWASPGGGSHGGQGWVRRPGHRGHDRPTHARSFRNRGRGFGHPGRARTSKASARR